MLCGVTSYRFQYTLNKQYSKICIEINNLRLNSFKDDSRQNRLKTLNRHLNHILFLAKILVHPLSPPKHLFSVFKEGRCFFVRNYLPKTARFTFVVNRAVLLGYNFIQFHHNLRKSFQKRFGRFLCRSGDKPLCKRHI